MYPCTFFLDDSNSSSEVSSNGDYNLTIHYDESYDVLQQYDTQDNTTTNVFSVFLYDENSSYTVDESFHKQAEHIIYSQVIVGICVFGILGNILNLLVLTRKSMQVSMDRMERSAHAGLVALALSDLLFCVTLMPHAWVQRDMFQYNSSPYEQFEMFYNMYSEGVISILSMASTWLTVAMGTSRYLAICHPLKAREVIGMTFAKVSIAVVFLTCIIFNLPRFWRNKMESIQCVEGYKVYFPTNGFLIENQVFSTSYYWIYFIIGLLIPLVFQIFFNHHLIRALQKSTKLRQKYKHKDAHAEGTHRITLTLIIIIVMYILLVTPAEVVNFLKQTVINNEQITDSYNLALAIVNALQALNFAFNFILYCVVNVHFRDAMRELFCCCIMAKKHRNTRYSTLSRSTNIGSRYVGTEV